MKTEPKFKAGDTVHIINAEDHVGVYRSETIYSIAAVDDDDTYIIVGDDDDHWYFDDTELELVHSVDVKDVKEGWSL